MGLVLGIRTWYGWDGALGVVIGRREGMEGGMQASTEPLRVDQEEDCQYSMVLSSVRNNI